ncbi:MAG: MFS transporter, partial [Verrucomicrobia bacterium]|nr:MFS transporter [Verrucomicrobiota bacterium]
MWNESISEQYRGRIASFSMLSYMSGPLLGNTLMGFLGDSVGLHQALALGGTVSLVTIGLVVLLVPPFRRYASPS